MVDVATAQASNAPPKFDLNTMSNDDILGPEPKFDLTKQTNEDILGPEPSTFQTVKNAVPYFLGGGQVAGDVARDQFYRGTAVGRILDAFGQGAKDNWGSEPVGMSEDARKWMSDVGLITNDKESVWRQPFKAFNEAFFRAGATAWDLAMRAPAAAVGGIASGTGQTAQELGASPTTNEQLSQDINILPFAVGDTAITMARPPEAPLPKALQDAHDLNVIGPEGETGWKGSPVAAPEVAEEVKGQTPEQQAAISDTKEAEKAAETEKSAPQAAPQTAPTIDEVARKIDPGTMDQWQALSTRRDTYRQWISDLSQQKMAEAEAKSPFADTIRNLTDQIAETQGKIEDATPRLAKKYQARIDDFQTQLADAQAQHDEFMQKFAVEGGDIDRVRQALMKADYAMRDMAPQISDLYRQAQAQMGGEEAPVAPVAEQPQAAPEQAPVTAAQPTEAPAPQQPAKIAPVPAEAVPAAGEPSNVVGKETLGGRKAMSEDEIHSEVARLSNEIESLPADRRTSSPLEEALKTASSPTGVLSWEQVAGGTKTAKAVSAIKAAREAGRQDIVDLILARADTEASRSQGKKSRLAPDDPNFQKNQDRLDELAADDREMRQQLYDAAGRQEEPSIAEQRAQIEKDVVDKLTKAGRPVDEANAAAALISARYETRAERFGGAKGNALDLYNAEAPEIATGGNKAKRGTIRVGGDQKPTIRLMQDADASTFMHETGHAWLEELMSDAKEEGVHDSVKTDAQTVRDWLGNDGGDLTRAQHEKFAKSFEQYLFTGQAPMPRLAEVFRQFRDWLSTIYNAVTGRGIKISDDIRDVFDRLIAVNPERQPLLTKESTAKTLADLHEIDAEHTPAEIAAEAGHNIEAEMGNAAQPPVDEDIRERATGSGPGAEDTAASVGAGEEAGNNEPGSRGGPSAPSEVGGGPGKGEAEGIGAREGTGAAEAERHEGEVLTLPKQSGLATEVPTSAHQPFEPERKPQQYFDKAGNIRLENLNRPDDIKNVLRTVADENNGFEEARGGVKTLVDQQATADALGLTPQDFSPNRPAGVSESTWLRAVRDLTLRSATDVRDLMVKARDSGEDADAAALGKALARHTMIQGEFSRAKAESGRALAANRWDDARAMVEGVGKMAEEATGMTLNQLKQMARDGAAMETPAQVSKFVNDVQKPGLRDKIQFVALNGLISGPVTHMTYEIASMLTVLEESLLERPLAAAYGTARDLIAGPTQGRVYWGEVGPTLYGAIKGGRDGVRAAIDAWRSNVTSKLPGEELAPGFDKRMGTHPEPPIGGPIGTVIGAPGRVVTAMHSFNRNVFYSMNIASMAVRMANDLGLTGDALSRKIADLTANPTEDMMKASIDYANGLAYMKKPEFGSAMYHIEKFSNSNLATKLMLPFTRVAANIIDRAYVERTPIGLLKGQIRDDLLGKNGAAAADFARARMTAGALIGGTLTGLALSGQATGAGPTAPAERQLWLVDHQPYSVRIGDTWVPYKRLGHLGMLMGLGANIAESINEYTDKGAELAAVQLAHGVATNVVDESWMAGVSNLLKIVEDPARAKNYMFSTASEVVPFSAFMRQSANALDPYAREDKGIAEHFQNMVPFWRNQLPPRRNVWGEPIPSSQSAPYALAASPFQTMISDDPTTAELQRVGAFPARASQKIRGVDLTPEQYDDFTRVSGRLMKARLDQIVASPGWAQMPDQIKAEVAHKIIDGSREAARGAIMMQYPTIVEQAVAAKRQAMH